jgi:UDP-glucose 4-epimerase
VLRLGNVYGQRQSAHGEAGVVAIFSGALNEGRPVTVFGDGLQTRDYVHVTDVARAFLLAARGRERATYNVGTGEETTVLRLLDLLERAAGTEAERNFEPLRAGELTASALDSSRIGAALGWTPEIGLEQGLAETYAWYRDQPG